MSRNLEIRAGDYVLYTGSDFLPEGILREAAVGKVDHFESTHDDIQRIYLLILNKARYIWCDFDKVRIIETEAKHLKACGYTLESTGKPLFRRGLSVVSQTAFEIPALKFTMFTGFRAADFSKPIDMKRYLKEAPKFDYQLFDLDYPSVNNLNDLFEYIIKAHTGIALNMDEIARL